MPAPQRLTEEKLRAILTEEGSELIELFTKPNQPHRFVRFKCVCGLQAERRASHFPAYGGKCKKCTKRFVNPPVTEDVIRARLEPAGCHFLSKEILTKGPRSSYTVVHFTCKCGKEVTRSWVGLNKKGSTPYCQICAQPPQPRGKDSPFYIHDHPNRQREDLRWRAADDDWVKAILVRDNYTCCISGQQGGRLAAHHLNSRTNYPELKFDLNNGITISADLHNEFHRRPGCKRNPTAEQFLIFYQEKTGEKLSLPDYIIQHARLSDGGCHDTGAPTLCS